jgi:hypothetical protein
LSVGQAKPVQWGAKTFPGGVWIQIPQIPPSLNVWSRWHWAKRDRYLKQLTRDLGLIVKTYRLPRFEEATVQVVYYFPDARHRDKDNYGGKFFLDALRYAGILKDDNADLISLPEPNFQVDRQRPRTELFIWSNGSVSNGPLANRNGQNLNDNWLTNGIGCPKPIPPLKRLKMRMRGICKK